MVSFAGINGESRRMAVRISKGTQMKLAAVTFGTEGDTRPIATLCGALRDAGHTVILLAGEGTLGSARELGVPHAALAGDIRSMVVFGKAGLNAGTRAISRVANDNATAWMRQTLESATGCDTIVCAGLAAFVGFSVAEKLGIPALGAGMIPLTPTADFPSSFLPPRRVPRSLNRFSHLFVAEMLWRAFRRAINEARVGICGLPPRSKQWSAQPMLYGISPSLLPKPTDWPSNAYMCGQWVRPVDDWDAPQPLQDFLAAGEAPIYVGFGSLLGFDRNGMRDAVVTAVAGRRALFYPGWSGAQGLELPKNFCLIEDTPHDWLFRRTSLVIHHGGSGTTHSAARAGRPSVVLPFAGDQPFWAERLRLLGVAPQTTSGRNVNAHSLKLAINAAETTEMRNRATALGEKMRAEDGLASTVAIIDSLVNPHVDKRRDAGLIRQHVSRQDAQ
jgi:sterol 3beta-glucosyltransferase